MKKIIFLDFDGVMDTDYYCRLLRINGQSEGDDFGVVFDPDCIKNLGRIISETGADIVVSSSWKIFMTYEHILKMWEARHLPGFVTDTTPNVSNHRGDEIEAWLKECRSECQYVIIDDLDSSNFNEDQLSHLLVVDPYNGLDDITAERTINILNSKDMQESESQPINTISAHLRDIELQHNVKVLLAVESGSRAWGFESKNSDWDVRFIYVHKPEWYLKVEEQRDVIEYMYEDDVDIVGWELRKALSLLRRSNPSLLEWFYSPKVYYVDEEFGERIKEVANDFFNPIKSMCHYNRIYNKHNERYQQQEGYPMKRFLYYLRGVLACKWIETNRTIPPVRFQELYEAMVTDADIKSKIEDLIEIKKEGKECDMLMVDNGLVRYAQNLADYYNETIGQFRPEQNMVTTDALDAILYDMVMKNT